MAKQTPEGRVKDAIRKHLKENHPDNFHFVPVSNGMGKHGIPDFICCIPTIITEEMVGHTLGVFVGIEAKTIKGKISPQQNLRLDEIAAANGGAIVVWGSDDVMLIDDYILGAETGLPYKGKPE